jgi:hypothetical protein
MIPGYRRSRARAGGLPPTHVAARKPATDRSAELLRLQATAGNQATASAISAMAVQRAPKPAGGNTGGELELDGMGSIPLRAATWAVESNVKPIAIGSDRAFQLEPTGREIQSVVLTREPDEHSSAIDETFRASVRSGVSQDAGRNGTLRLGKPSRDGRLPATTVGLSDVMITSYTRTSGKRPVETVTLAVGDLTVGGRPRSGPIANAIGSVQLHGDQGAPWPALPVLSWERIAGGRQLTQSVGGVDVAPKGEPVRPGAPRARVKIIAGPALERLSELMGSRSAGPRRLERLVYKPRKGGQEQQLFEVLLTKLASTSEGPEVIEVEFAAER